MWSVACVCRLCPENVSNGPFPALPLASPPTRVTSTEALPLTRCGLEPSQGIRLREQSPPSLADSGLPAAGHWPAGRLLTWPTRLEQRLPAPDRLPAPLQRKVQPLPPNAVKGHRDAPSPRDPGPLSAGHILAVLVSVFYALSPSQGRVHFEGKGRGMLFRRHTSGHLQSPSAREITGWRGCGAPARISVKGPAFTLLPIALPITLQETLRSHRERLDVTQGRDSACASGTARHGAHAETPVGPQRAQRELWPEGLPRGTEEGHTDRGRGEATLGVGCHSRASV